MHGVVEDMDILRRKVKKSAKVLPNTFVDVGTIPGAAYKLCVQQAKIVYCRLDGPR